MRHDLQANTCLGTCDYFLCLEMTSDLEVQFQNRRNRTRKEGQEFKRKPRNEALKLSLDAMIGKMSYSTILENQGKPYVEEEKSEYEWQYESDEEDVVSTALPTRFGSSNFIVVGMERKASTPSQCKGYPRYSCSTARFPYSIPTIRHALS